MSFNAVAFFEDLFRPPSGRASDDDSLGSDAPDFATNINPTDLPPEWHFAWDERAAIREFDGGEPRERAEALALAEILVKMRAVGDYPWQ